MSADETRRESAQDPFVGQRFGSCLLQRRVDSGAAGHVYLAHHVGLNKPVSVRILPAELVGDVQRFLREARAAAALEHPNVVQILDAGEANGLCYLAQRRVEGRGLDQRLEEEGKLGVREANGIVEGIALALAAAHRLGIVHRDIRPANVLISKDGQVRLAGFGLARSGDSERARGLPADARADLYSLGATYYHLVTGRLPFEGGAPAGLEEPPPPERIEPSVPPDVSRLILKLLAKKPEERFPTAEDFLRALAAVDEPGRRAEASTSGGAGESLFDLFSPAPPGAPPRPAPEPAVGTSPAREGGRDKDRSPENHLKAEGKNVVGNYLLLREIQKEDEDLSIWEAENIRTRSRATLHLLNGRDPERVRAFQKLAADVMRLQHPNILQVVECRSDSDGQGRATHVVAVERVESLPLDAVVSSRMLPLKELLQLCRQVADALEHAHQKRQAHLALAPREIQVEPPSRALISCARFGTGLKEESLEAAPFLAPEQVPGADAVADASTDIYRLGAVLYWIVTGAAPFEASSLDDYHRMIPAIEPRMPRELDPKVDAELDRIVAKALRKEKAFRYARAGDLAADLRRYLRTDAREAAASPPARPAPSKPFESRVRIFLKTWRKQVVAGAVVASILLAGAVGLTVVRLRMAEASLAEDLGAERIEAFQRYSEGKFEEALSAAGRALALSPGDVSMTDLSRKCRRRILEAAVLAGAASLEEAAGRSAEDEYLERLGHLEDPLRDLRGAVGGSPSSAALSSVTAAGLGAFATGDYEAAEGLLEKAFALESKDPRGLLELARASFARHVLADAAAFLLGAPGDRDPRSRAWLARVVDAVNRPTQPAREGLDADLADLYAAAGRGELERAKALAGALLRRAPPPAAAAEALAIRAYSTGGGDGGDLDASLRERPLQILAYVLRARRMAELGRYDEAAKDLAVPSRLHPHLPLLPLLRAKALHAAGDPEEALTELARAKLKAGRDWEYGEKLELLERALPRRPAPPKEGAGDP